MQFFSDIINLSFLFQGESEGTLHHPTVQKNTKEKKQPKEILKEESENEDNGVEAAEDAYLSDWLNKKTDSEEVSYTMQTETIVKFIS